MAKNYLLTLECT